MWQTLLTSYHIGKDDLALQYTEPLQPQGILKISYLYLILHDDWKAWGIQISFSQCVDRFIH